MLPATSYSLCFPQPVTLLCFPQPVTLLCFPQSVTLLCFPQSVTLCHWLTAVSYSWSLAHRSQLLSVASRSQLLSVASRSQLLFVASALSYSLSSLSSRTVVLIVLADCCPHCPRGLNNNVILVGGEVAPRGSNAPGALRTHTVAWYTLLPGYPGYTPYTVYTTAPLYTRRPACTARRNRLLGSMALIPSGPEVPG